MLFSTLSILSYISVLGMYLLVWKSMNIILVLFLLPLSTGTFKTLSVIVLHVSFLFLCAGIRGIRKAQNPGSLIFQENSSYPEKWAKRAQNALQNRIMDRHARFFFEVNDNFTRRFRQTYLVIGSHIVALKETFPQEFPRANETKYLVMKYQLNFFY